ncbi:hypothetical protein [Chromobacterium sp. IIBBL 290-4]|uniref:hypothetical protein n=1 Tax=Chromobacterium sp. IIBBL 290-4 TaxID=2953890 RepID=UPI0020B8771D|nr:hypothetical protein [Chromobacterium sp. IIBBL 290-4]UTH72507.1 hypothetical protein NKT35_13200 [Chromobacterium sp. IIBBL 290-4]
MSQGKQIIASISLVKFDDGSVEFTHFGDAAAMMAKFEAAEAAANEVHQKAAQCAKPQPAVLAA